MFVKLKSKMQSHILSHRRTEKRTERRTEGGSPVPSHKSSESERVLVMELCLVEEECLLVMKGI